MKFAGTEITPETIILTRQHFVESYEKCITDAVEYGTILKEELPDGKFFRQ